MPGVRVNLSKRGMSTSIGGNGVTYNTRSRRTTVSIPGTGLRYTSKPQAVSGQTGLLVALLSLLLLPFMILLRLCSK
jgi:hypothetical protein